MSANVETMVSGRNLVPWHKIGELEPGLFTAKVALKKGGLDWEVRPHQVYININEHKPGLDPIFKLARDPEREIHTLDKKTGKYNIEIVPGEQPFAIVRQDRGGVLTTNVTKQYKPLQNSDAALLCEYLTGSYGGARFETAGVLDHGRRVWFLVEFEAGKKFTLAGDEIKQYLLLTNGHDGKNSLICILTPVRVVCQNTLNMALKGANRKFSSKHIGENMDLDTLKSAVREIIGLTGEYYTEMAQVADRLAVQKVSPKQQTALLAELFPLPDDHAPSIKKQNAVQKARELVRACMAAEDLANNKNTAWMIYNAVADYSDHMRSLKGSESRGGMENEYLRTFEGTDLKDQCLELLLAIR